MIFVFGVFVFEFDKKKGFDYLENVFKCEFECEFDMNLKNLGDLLGGALLVPQPQPTPHTFPTPYHTPATTPNPRKFDILGGEYDYLFNIFEYEKEGFEFEKNMNLKIFGGLLKGQPLCPPPYTPRPTDNPTPRPIPNPREFCFLGGENNVLLNIFGNENFLENEINVYFEHFENGM